MSQPPPECSLHKNNGTRWTRALTTFPEGAPHPVRLSVAGDCQECMEGLVHAAKKPFPTAIEKIDGPSAARRDIPLFCDCEFCVKFRNLINA